MQTLQLGLTLHTNFLVFVTNPFPKGLFAFLLSLGQPGLSLLPLSPAAAGSVPSATSADVPVPQGSQHL